MVQDVKKERMDTSSSGFCFHRETEQFWNKLNFSVFLLSTSALGETSFICSVFFLFVLFIFFQITTRIRIPSPFILFFFLITFFFSQQIINCASRMLIDSSGLSSRRLRVETPRLFDAIYSCPGLALLCQVRFRFVLKGIP